METRFIFVVGVSRSGTTLMRRILNKSDYIAITDENHFLGHLLPWEGARYYFRRFGDLSRDENVQRLVDDLYSGQFARRSKWRGVSYHWEWIVEWVEREKFLQKILASDRSERALFTVMMQVYAEHFAKPIAGEKTPAHLRYVPTLMAWFPEGKIVHMLRDPRGIFISDLRRRREAPITPPFKQLQRFDFLFKLYLVGQITIAWWEGIRRYRRYHRLYPDRYYLMRFEDLVSDPETHVRRLCDFLGIEFQDKMLEQRVVSDGFQAGQTGFDTNAATRWQQHIDPWIDAWFSFCFKKDLEMFGYR